MRFEELRYAKFMARRHYLANVIPHQEFKQLVSQVSLSLVYYDPNFDFFTGGDPLRDRTDAFMIPPYRAEPFNSQFEVRYQPRSGLIYGVN